MDKNGDTAPLKNGSFSSTRKFLGITSIISANYKITTYISWNQVYGPFIC